jgi:hypothetical protein
MGEAALRGIRGGIRRLLHRGGNVMKRFKLVVPMLVGILAVAAGSLWTIPVEPLAPSEPGISASTGVDQGHPSDGECAAVESQDTQARSCQDCPAKRDGCGRVSCNPCCYRCPGDPILRCL